MASKTFGAILFLCAVACAFAARADELPNAPDAQQQMPPTHPVPATRPADPAAVQNRKWSVVVEPGETVPPLTTKDKFLFPAHETARWSTPLSFLWSGWYGIWRDSDPHYGVNAEGWGERVGADAARQGMVRELGDGLLPILFHEDPRYFRQAEGTYKQRALYAVTRVLVTQRDSGRKSFNFSKVLGRGGAAGLTQTFYPQSSVGADVVFKTWGTSLATLAGTNLFNEFWPDVKRKVFHKRK